jgi:Tfp pilus assembly protein PilF
MTTLRCARSLITGCLLVLAFVSSVWAECNISVTDAGGGIALDYADQAPEVRSRIRTVENHHFNANVESLKQGQTTSLPVDIEFLLRYVPNHYRGLAAYSKWELQNPRMALGRPRSAECYYKRAINFRPEDPRLHFLLGTFLHKAGRLAEARVEYDRAETMGLASSELYYNRGLLELDAGDLDRARSYADRAYSLGYPFPGLRNRIQAQSQGRPQ